MQSSFWKFSTAGNTTLIVDKQEILPQAIAAIGAEQAGWAAGANLEMAGGEMCVNASLAFAAFLRMRGSCNDSALISGEEVQLGCQGEAPEWQCWAEINIGDAVVQDYGEIIIQHLPGISHALIMAADFPPAQEALAEAAHFRRTFGLEQKPAAGVVWWRRLSDELEIMPVVSVPGAGTCNLEAACGSGSIALARCLPSGRYRIKQPSGGALIVETGAEKVLVKGQAHLLAHGSLYG